jgi:hypothetical protein
MDIVLICLVVPVVLRATEFENFRFLRTNEVDDVSRARKIRFAANQDDNEKSQTTEHAARYIV